MIRAPFSGELLVFFLISLRKTADKRRSSRVRRSEFYPGSVTKRTHGLGQDTYFP